MKCESRIDEQRQATTLIKNFSLPTEEQFSKSSGFDYCIRTEKRISNVLHVELNYSYFYAINISIHPNLPKRLSPHRSVIIKFVPKGHR